jgi:hypothetical protein
VTPCIGIIKLGKVTIGNIPAPIPINPGMVEVNIEMNPKINSTGTTFP